MSDRHFMTQSELVTPTTTPYTKVYETGEIPLLLNDLATHLRAQGWDGTLALGQSNETPLTPLASLFTPDVTEGIRSVYGVDFDAFGYADPVPAKTDPAGEYPRALLVAVGLLAERGERLGDLAVRAQSLADANRELRSERKALRRENKALRSRPRIRSVVRRVYRKLSPPG